MIAAILLLASVAGAAVAADTSMRTSQILSAFHGILRAGALGPWLANRAPCREWAVRPFRDDTLAVVSLPVEDRDCERFDRGDRFLFTWPSKRIFLLLGENRVPLARVDSLVPTFAEERILSEGLVMPPIRLGGLFGDRKFEDPGPAVRDPYQGGKMGVGLLLMGAHPPAKGKNAAKREFEWTSRVTLSPDDAAVSIKSGRGRWAAAVAERIESKVGSAPSVPWPLGKPGSGHLSLAMRLDTAGKVDSVRFSECTPGLEFLRKPMLDWARSLRLRQGAIEPNWIQAKFQAEAFLERTVPDSLWKPGTVELREGKNGKIDLRPVQ